MRDLARRLCGAAGLVLLVLGLAVTSASAQAPTKAQTKDKTAEAPAVWIKNTSEPVLCAEKDNVTLSVSSSTVKRFRIEAMHPAYLDTLAKDNFAADWTACDMSKDAAHASDVAAPTRRTLYEEPGLWVVGWVMPTYWRPATVPFRIGDHVETGLHLIQVWMIRPMAGEEVLVLYPQDGYWRIRPLAPEGRAATAFGSSLLIGPVEVEGRPIVKFKEVAFDPKAKTFSLSFVRGGKAMVAMSEVTSQRHALDVSFDAVVNGLPFAAIRSMYVTEFNNDTARVAVREPGAPGWKEAPVMEFKGGAVTELWTGRTNISRHNASSPDLVLRGFGG
ncbi:MAG: hypothetical protein JSS20_08210 [Proteobacteria bacterium]|nr:hypothetical protein [Pseudomonadota bacterium]